MEGFELERSGVKVDSGWKMRTQSFGFCFLLAIFRQESEGQDRERFHYHQIYRNRVIWFLLKLVQFLMSCLTQKLRNDAVLDHSLSPRCDACGSKYAFVENENERLWNH